MNNYWCYLPKIKYWQYWINCDYIDIRFSFKTGLNVLKVCRKLWSQVQKVDLLKIHYKNTRVFEHVYFPLTISYLLRYSHLVHFHDWDSPDTEQSIPIIEFPIFATFEVIFCLCCKKITLSVLSRVLLRICTTCYYVRRVAKCGRDSWHPWGTILYGVLDMPVVGYERGLRTRKNTKVPLATQQELLR